MCKPRCARNVGAWRRRPRRRRRRGWGGGGGRGRGRSGVARTRSRAVFFCSTVDVCLRARHTAHVSMCTLRWAAGTCARGGYYEPIATKPQPRWLRATRRTRTDSPRKGRPHWARGGNWKGGGEGSISRRYRSGWGWARRTTCYAIGGQVAARRPGNEPRTPTRQEVRGRAQAVRNSQTFGRLLGQAVERCGSHGSATAPRGCAPSQSPAPCANSPCPSYL